MTSKLVNDFLNKQPAAATKDIDPRTHYKFDGEKNRGYIQLTAESTPQPDQYIKILEEVGLDPQEFRITNVKNFSGWQQTPDSPFLHAYRLDIETINSVDNLDLDDIFKMMDNLSSVPKPKTPKKKRKDVRVLHIGDLQIGKIENGEKGIADLLKRYHKTIKDFKETVEPGQPILVAHVGDCMEGNQSQSGRNMGYQTPLTMTEQIRVYRRLLMYTIKELAPLTHDLVVGVVNGNHDESDRRLNTKAGDGWATEAAIAVSDAIEDRPEFKHVKVFIPKETQGYFTVEVGKSRFLLMHGHQFPRPGGIAGAEKWLKDAAFYQTPASAADFVLFGHFHTFQMSNQGPRTFICSSTYDGGSNWFAERKGGAWQNPYGLAFTANKGQWSNLHQI